MKLNNKVAIVGAGVGGLATALRLAHQGFQVEVFEKGDGPGGRCGRIEDRGFVFDTGPTLLLMPEVLEETLSVVGKKLSDYLTLIKCDPNYQIHFRDGSEVTFTSDLVKMGQELERIEPGSFQRYLAFMAQGRLQYKTSLDRFVGRNFDSVLQFLTPKNLSKVFAVRAHRNMYSEISRFFSDDRLRASLTFQTMYLGISPFESPAVYGLLPYTELGDGIWFPKGGMYALPLALEKVAKELGVVFHYGQSVEQIEIKNGIARGLRLAGGETVEAGSVVCNADLPWAYRNLISPKESALKNAEALKYTSSAFMMYWGMKKTYPTLKHHNVILGGDYKGSFGDIFDRLIVPKDPSFYINAHSRTDPDLAPAGKDSLYVLVPVPNRKAKIDWKEEGPALRQKVLTRLSELGLNDIEENIEVEHQLNPNDWETQLNLERGSAFGLSHHFFQVGPFRPTNQDPKVRNLFFVGASTQPGTGLPMVMLSARLVTERVLSHFERGAAARAA